MTFASGLLVAFITSILSELANWYFVFGTKEYKIYQDRINNIQKLKKKTKISDKDLRHYTMLSSRMQFKSLIFTSVILFVGYNYVPGDTIVLPFKAPFSYLQRNIKDPTEYLATDMFVYVLGMAVFKSLLQKLLNGSNNMQLAFKLAQEDFEKKWNS
eukprot:NODE_124_length_17341_cov_0.560028.p12 type:complete len:157 gc:universal NODE_124_length_17341_cov_0.560028:12764-13234(+)